MAEANPSAREVGNTTPAAHMTTIHRNRGARRRRRTPPGVASRRPSRTSMWRQQQDHPIGAGTSARPGGQGSATRCIGAIRPTKPIARYFTQSPTRRRQTTISRPNRRGRSKRRGHVVAERQRSSTRASKKQRATQSGGSAPQRPGGRGRQASHPPMNARKANGEGESSARLVRARGKATARPRAARGDPRECRYRDEQQKRQHRARCAASAAGGAGEQNHTAMTLPRRHCIP